MSTVLVTGSTGFLGPYLVDAFEPLGRVVGVARHLEKNHCDLTDRGAVKSLLSEVRPDIVVHAAALTNVDYCENNPALAEKINRDATAILVEHLPRNAAFLYVSTDQVYPGTNAPHIEGSERPVNVYGSTKLSGEQAALQHSRALVLRTNLFGFSRGRKAASLVDFLVDKFRKRESVSLFTDVLFSPLHVATMVACAVECMRRQLTGTFNLGSNSGTSKSDFALAVANHLGLPTENIQQIQSISLPFRAPRPLDMRMDVTRIESVLGCRMPSLADEIKRL